MSRKPPTDTFTRFTSTTPSSSSPSFSAQQPGSKPTETAAQRVARLRAQHVANREAQIPSSDRVLARGRRFADIAHRATTYTLLGFSAAATVVAVYGFFSLVGHNRTQKRAWIEREMDRLEAARAAFLRGEADAEQLHLLEQERVGEILQERHEEEKRKRKWTTKLKSFFTTSEGDKGEGETLRERGERVRREHEEMLKNPPPQRFRMGDAEVELRPAAVAESAVAGVGLDDGGRPVPINKMEPQRQTGPPPTAAGEVSQTRRGGLLDHLANNITTDASSVTSSVWSSIFGRGSKP